MAVKKIAFCAIVFFLSAFSAKAQKTFDVNIKGAVGNLKCVVQFPKLKQNQRCPLVVIMHGFTGNKNETLLKQIADGLQQRGVGSVRFDFNGHGESDGKFQNMTIANEIEDAKKIIKEVRGSRYVDPNNIALIGHSQGGVVASMTAGILGNNVIKALVLLAPAGNIGEQSKKGILLGTRFDPNHVPETLSVWNHTVGKQYLVYAMNCDMYGTAAKYQGPVCIIHGTNDKAVPFAFGKKYADCMKNAEWVLLQNDDHGLSKHRPQTLNKIYSFITTKLK